MSHIRRNLLLAVLWFNIICQQLLPPEVSAEIAPSQCDATGLSCFDLRPSSPLNPGDAIVIVAADLAYQVYNDSATITSYATGRLGNALTTVRFFFDSATSTEAVVASGEVIVVAFRGSEDAADWFTNSQIVLQDVSFGAGGIGNVHLGFQRVSNTIYSQLKSILQALDPLNEKPLIFTGHSLGSALAMILAAKIQGDQSIKNTIDAVYSFAGPRVGGSKWQAVYNSLELSDKTLRFVYYKDIVPLIPPESTKYVHVGKMYFFDRKKTICQLYNFEEYDICSNDEQLFSYTSIFAGFVTCAAFWFFSPILLPGCAALKGLSVTTNDLASTVLASLCGASGSVLVDGSACCLLVQMASDVAGYKIVESYHNMSSKYLGSVYMACADTCATQQYRTCGGGWTAADQELFDSFIEFDPTGNEYDGIITPIPSQQQAKPVDSLPEGDEEYSEEESPDYTPVDEDYEPGAAADYAPDSADYAAAADYAPDTDYATDSVDYVASPDYAPAADYATESADYVATPDYSTAADYVAPPVSDYAASDSTAPVADYTVADYVQEAAPDNAPASKDYAVDYVV